MVSGVHSIYPLFPSTKVSRKQRAGVHTHIKRGRFGSSYTPPFNPLRVKGLKGGGKTMTNWTCNYSGGHEALVSMNVMEDKIEQRIHGDALKL